MKKTFILLILFGIILAGNVLAFDKSDYLKLEETRVGLTSAYSEYVVCNPTAKDYVIDSSDKLKVDFMQVKNSLKSYEILTPKTIEKEVPNYETTCTTKEVIVPEQNGSAEHTFDAESCETIQKGTRIVESKEWVKLNPIGKTFKSGKCYRIRVAGEYSPNMGQTNIDNVISYAGMSFDEYDWWNVSFDYCVNLNLTEPTDMTNRTDYLLQIGIDANNWSTRPFNDSVRLVNAPCSNDGAEINSDLRLINQSTSGLMNKFTIVAFTNLTDVNQGNYEWSIYFDNESKGNASYNNNFGIVNSSELNARDYSLKKSTGTYKYNFQFYNKSGYSLSSQTSVGHHGVGGYFKNGGAENYVWANWENQVVPLEKQSQYVIWNISSVYYSDFIVKKVTDTFSSPSLPAGNKPDTKD